MLRLRFAGLNMTKRFLIFLKICSGEWEL